MDLARVCRMGYQHLRNAAAEALYLQTGLDLTRPTVIHALVTERCNCKCRYCGFWRRDGSRGEMTVEQWQEALASLKELAGRYFVEFSGGEPFVKKGFLDLLRFCNASGISFGVTTNGMPLAGEPLAREMVGLRPFNINVSVDAPVAEVHDYLRGAPGSLEQLSRGIRNLLREQRDQRIGFPIVIKPTVNALNFRLLPDLVDWVKWIGAAAVNFQPMDRWTPETEQELWIGEKDIPDLRRIAGRLVERKRAGDPIMNSEAMLRLLPAHFRGEKAPDGLFPCRVGLRNWFLHANGDVEVCWEFALIGNLREQSAREIWYGPAAARVRRQTVRCRKLCLFTCLSQKTVADRARMALMLVKGARRPAAALAATPVAEASP